MINYLNKYINSCCHFLPSLLIIILTSTATMVSAQQLCEDEGNLWNRSWVSCEKTLTPNPSRSDTFHWLQYEFEEVQSIESIEIWNANRIGESTMGAQNIVVDYSIDGITWVSNAATLNVPQASEQNNYQGVLFPSGFENLFVKKILLVLTSNYGDANCSSISEARFLINQDACYGTLDECGECDGEGATTWYIDSDGDGLGHIGTSIQDCNQPIGYVDNFEDYCDNGLLGWNEVRNIFDDNGCFGCHDESATGGLNLTTYESTIVGGNKCGPNIITGTTLANIIMISGYDGCGQPIGFPSMNERVGGQIDAQELALIQTWIDAGAPEDCNCLAGASDVDNDGTCDAIDNCPGFDNSIIGTPCNDGIVCTENDIWTSACNCAGTPMLDSDNDGVCDLLDLEPSNPCTADGVIDGEEPFNWVALPTNDCDQDNISNSDGDLDDFSECINDIGTLPVFTCFCPDINQIEGGAYTAQSGVGSASNSDGLPDGIVTEDISGSDRVEIKFPSLPRGEQICITIGFELTGGKVNFSLNDNSFTFLNTAGLVGYQLQEICINTQNTGPQTLIVTETGDGSIRLDGSRFGRCIPCTDDILDESFDNTLGSFTVVSGAFSSPNAMYESFSQQSESIVLGVGGVDNTIQTNMSIGVNTSFEVSRSENITVEINYILNAGVSYESDEWTQALAYLDGQPLMYDRNNYLSQLVSGSPSTTGTRVAILSIPAPSVGTHTLTVGLLNNQKTQSTESSSMIINNISIVQDCPLCDPLFVGQPCDDGDVCTTGDIFDADCNCIGVYQDSDNDGICDGEDCVDGFAFVDESFNNTLGSFTVVSGAFSSPNAMYESFSQQSESIVLGVGGVDNTRQTNMSIGVSTSFEVSNSENITIEINYELNVHDSYDSDEWTLAIAYLDGQPLIYNGNNYLSELVSGSPSTTGTQVVTLSIPSPSVGTHTLTVGLLNNQKTQSTESSSMIINNISIVQDCTLCDPLFVGQPCDDGDVCTTGDIFDADCNCIGVYQDSDNDGICDVEDCVDGFAFVDESFNNTLGSFTVVSGAFSSPNAMYESFSQQSDSIVLGVGGVDNTTQTNMSIGVNTSFEVSRSENITVEINYILNAHVSYESDEWTQALAYLDGQPLMYDGNNYLSELVSGSPSTTGTRVAILTIPSPSAGTHSLTVGLLNNQKTQSTESSSMIINNISIVQDCPLCDPLFVGQPCDDGDVCTTGETYDSDCNCIGGTFQDSDEDGVCDANDDCLEYADITDSYTVVSGAFSSPNAMYESFSQQSDTIVLGVGGVDNTTQTNMSIGVNTSFEVSRSENITVEINYILNAHVSYESDEWTQALAYLDGQPLMYDGNNYLSELVSGSPSTTGTRVAILTIPSPSAGTHSLTVGLLNNQKTQSTESSSMIINNISIVQDCSLCDPLFVGQPCDDGDVCTTGETYDSDCNCIGGTFQDSDEDGVCDANDDCPEYAVITDSYAPMTIAIVEVSDSIVASNIIEASADVTYNAGVTILLESGFEVKQSAIFHAYINGCSN